MGGTLVLGVFFYRTGKGGYLLGAASLITFLIAVAALISFISLYIYELPTHHCPFCILQAEYHYLGYPLYLTLLAGVVAGLGAGVLTRFRNLASLREVVPAIQRRLTLVALAAYALFTLMAIYEMLFSNLKM
jgi:hypothetical protein